MKLKIEHGQLLMPYAAPWSGKEKVHRRLDAWTPERTPEMHDAFDALKTQHDTAPDHIIWNQVEADEAERMEGKPLPGWIPIVYSRGGIDKKIGDAYRALFVRMNGEHVNLLVRGASVEGRKAQMPSDGDYVYEGGVMRRTG